MSGPLSISLKLSANISVFFNCECLFLTFLHLRLHLLSSNANIILMDHNKDPQLLVIVLDFFLLKILFSLAELKN